MSNMTAYASEPSDNTRGGYYEEAADSDSSELGHAEEAEADDASKDAEHNEDEKDDVKEASEETVEATETTDEEAEETQTSKEEQTSETESSLREETETTEAEETSEEEQTSEVDNEEGEADTDGFYNGLTATQAEEGKSYHFDFQTQIEDFNFNAEDSSPYTKGLFTFSKGTSTGNAQYHSEQHGIAFKVGNKLKFAVSGDSYIVVGGNSNSSANLKASCSDENGTFYRDFQSSKTNGIASADDCKTKGKNTVIFEYSGSAGSVTLTLSGGSDAYIGNVCVIPLSENDKTATQWKFDDTSFNSISQENSSSFTYKGLVCSSAKNNQNKYLLADAESTITVPVKDMEKPGKIVVKACYDYAFSFGDGKKIARKSSNTNAIDSYEYYYEAGTENVVINVKGGSYFNEIQVAEDTQITDITEWDFQAHNVDAETAIDELNGLTIIGGGKKNNNGSLRIANGLISVPVKGKCTIEVTTNYNWEIGFYNLDNAFTNNTSSNTLIKYEYDGGKGMVPIIIGNSATTYIDKIAVIYGSPIVEYVEEGIMDFSGDNSSKIYLNKQKGVTYTEAELTFGNSHGIQTNKGIENAKLTLSLKQKANITVKSCCYGAGVNATVTATSGTSGEPVQFEEEAGKNGLIHTITDVEAGNVVLSITEDTYIISIRVEYISDSSENPEISFTFDPVTEGIANNGLATEKGSKFVNNYFEVVNGSIIGKNGSTVELANKAGSAIQFTTKGKAVVVIDACSTNGTNSSDIVLYKVESEKNTIVGKIETVKGGTATTLTYSDLVEGTYMVAVPVEEHPNSRGVRVSRIKVTEAVTPVEVTVNVTAEGINDEITLSFTCNETGEEISKKVENGQCLVTLNAKYTYDIYAAPTKFIVKEGAKLEMGEASEDRKKTHNIIIEEVPLKTVTGSIKGLDDDAEAKKAIKVTFEKPKDKTYIPEININRTDMTYTVELETDVTYTIVTEGINDYELDLSVEGNTETIKAAEDDANLTRDITYKTKPVYDIIIEPEGAELTDLANAVFTFTNINEEGYIYTFTGTDNIKLRDGTYSVKVSRSGEFVQKMTSNLVVEGAKVTKKIGFESNITKWVFSENEGFTKDACNAEGTDESGASLGNYKGLLLTSVNNESGKAHAVLGAGSKIQIPVKETCDIAVTYYYRAGGTIGEDTPFGLEAGDPAYGSTNTTATTVYHYTHTEGSGKNYITLTASEQTFLTAIELIITKPYAETITVNPSAAVGNNNYAAIGDAIDAIRSMDRNDNQRVTVMIQPGNYEEMLIIDVPNVTFKNAYTGGKPSITPINKGVDISNSSVRITGYYGHGYDYYSMGSDYTWDKETLTVSKENNSVTNKNIGAGSGTYWNATVRISASGFEADGIIFENSFNQYISKKAAEDTVVPNNGVNASGEQIAKRATLPQGDTTVQKKEYVERAAALAIYNNCSRLSFNNCSFIGRQDTLYGGVGTTAAFYDCDIYGGTDYIFGGMTAVFAKCGLVFNTNEGNKNDVGYITAAQQSAGRGYLMYNCTVTSTIPQVNTASTKTSQPGYFGRPWAKNTAEALFYKTKIETTDYNGEAESLILPVGWGDGLSGKSSRSQEYGTIEFSGVDNSGKRAKWSAILVEDEDKKITLVEGTKITEENGEEVCVPVYGSVKVDDSSIVAAFLGDWNAFDGKDMAISTSTVASPVPDIAPGNVSKGRVITLTCTTEGAEIYYTTDGTDPTAESTKYIDPIPLGEELRTVTIKAIAIKGSDKSEIAILEYTITDENPGDTVSAPVASIPTGTTVEPSTAVTLTCATEGAEIFYTTDGTDPTAESNKYTGEIIIADTMTIKAIAIMGKNKSEISTFEYTVSSDKPIVVTTININDCEIAVSSILADSKKNPDNMPKTSVVYYVGKDRKGIPVRFAEGLDYKVSKPVLKEGNLYAVTLTGLGRSVDEYRIDPDSSCEMTFRVFDKKADKNSIIDLSKAKITLDGTQKGAIYTGKAFTPEVTEVKVGKDVIDMSKYKVSYKSNVNAGKASVIVSADSKAMYGEGEKFVIGTKAVTFTIKKAALNKADQITVTALDKDGKDFTNGSFPYRGIDVVEIDDLSVKTTSGQKNLREGIDYTVTYKNNRKVGKASAVIKGIGNNVSGSYTVPFKIEALNIGFDSQYKLQLVKGVSLQYTPNGAKLGLVCAYNEDDRIYLEEGVDFKVTYKYFDKSKAPGTDVDFTAKGINACTGYFSNKVNDEGNSFKIEKASLGKSFYLKADVIVDAAKATDSNKLQKAVEKALVLVDPYDGKLKVKKDYTVEVNEKDKKVLIRPAEKSYYLDADYVEDPYLQTDYTLATNIKTVKPDKKYTVSYDGRNPVQLDKDDISKLLGGLKLNEDVVIVKGSYKNNYKAGTASVTVQGIGNYYGTVTIKFKIIEA